MVPSCLMWCLWKERNERNFEDQEKLIEMIEGQQQFSTKQESEVTRVYALNERPPFRTPAKRYAHGLKELIEECCSEKPAKRPTFRQIIRRLESIHNSFGHTRRWKVVVLRYFQNLEAMLKKDHFDLSSRGHLSPSSTSSP